jgi:hypothetical protein
LREKMITDNVCDGGVARYDMCIKGIEIIEWHGDNKNNNV